MSTHLSGMVFHDDDELLEIPDIREDLAELHNIDVVEVEVELGDGHRGVEQTPQDLFHRPRREG